MRRTATTISTIFLLLSSILFAVNQEKVPERYKLQGESKIISLEALGIKGSRWNLAAGFLFQLFT